MGWIDRSDFENWIYQYMGISGFSDYLPNGLQVEGTDRISKVVTAVSINRHVIEEAIKVGAEAIIVHHGLFWKNDEPTVTLYRKQRIKLLLENEINLYAFHLPLDIHPEISHNRMILEGIGVESSAITPPPEFSGLEYGLIGRFSRGIEFKDLVSALNSYLEVDSKYFNFGGERVETVLVVSGAGRTLLDKVLNLGVDAYITGDAQENTGYICKEMSFNYIYAGHYNTEKPGIVALGDKIREIFNIDVVFISQSNEL